MSQVRLTAGSPLPLLVGALGRAGWGPLGQRSYQGLRALLRALADMLPARAGQGLTTQAQLADELGYTPRHVQDLILLAEEIGLVSYRRGQVWEGIPNPGFIRVHKSMIVDLIRAARPAHDQATRDRNHRTRLRVLRCTLKNLRSRQVPREGPELKPGLPPLKGKKAGSPRQPDPPNSLKEDKMLPPAVIDHLPQICIHGAKSPLTCNRCRYRAITDAQDAAKARPPEQPQLPVSPDPDPEIQAMFDYMTDAHPDLSPNTREWRRQLLRDSLDGLLQAWKEAREEALV